MKISSRKDPLKENVTQTDEPPFTKTQEHFLTRDKLGENSSVVTTCNLDRP